MKMLIRNHEEFIRIHNDILIVHCLEQYRVNYSYNSFDNIIGIDRTLYNIQQKDNYRIIVDNNKSRIDTPSPTDKLAITNYLTCFTREKKVEQICFL